MRVARSIQKAFLLVGLLLLTNLGLADEVHTSTVANVRVRTNFAYVRVASCLNYAILYLNTEYDKAMLALAMSAGAAGTPVEVQLDASCQTTEPQILFLDAMYQ